MTLSRTPTDEKLSREDLRTLFLFEALSVEQLQWLADRGWVADAPAGETILDEGAPADLVIILLSGTITLSRRVGPDDVEMSRTDQRGVYAGAMQSYLADADKLTYTATARALSESRLFVLAAADFGQAVREWFPMAIHLLEGLFFGMRNSQQIVGQRQQLLALGSLAAGLTHELNNPAAAAVRANAALRDRVAGMRHKLALLAHDEIDHRLLEQLAEITDSVTRISTLVEAARQYSHMDRAPFARADIHGGIKSTLAMLAGKLTGLEVVKDFDLTLPPVPIYGGELNQVWTNLIDNAVQAMNGSGTLTIRTSRDGDLVRAEIGDTGPGIPPDLRQRIFEPFFTTKPVGQGTGLGLDISYRIVVVRHGGDLTVESQPGDTRFIVKLPLTERPSS